MKEEKLRPIPHIKNYHIDIILLFLFPHIETRQTADYTREK